MIGAAGRIAGEITRGGHVAADKQSRWRLARDTILYRLLRLAPLVDPERTSDVRLRPATLVTYRLSRGDIYTLREVWLDETCRVPGDPPLDVVIDLGAHIGLTSLWLAARYRPSTLVAVEPSPANAALARRNFQQNGVDVALVEAGVGPKVGEAHRAIGGPRATDVGRARG